MKRITLIAIIALCTMMLSAITIIAEGKEVSGEIKDILDELLGDFGEGTELVFLDESQGGLSDDNAAYFGLNITDISFPKAQQLGLNKISGVLITKVVEHSPSWEYRLQADDVILKIDDVEILNQEVFDRVLSGLRAGDEIRLVIFRNKGEMKLNMVMGAKNKPSKKADLASEAIKGAKPKKKALSAGYGGGSWTPMYVNLDMKDINALLSQNALQLNQLNDEGVFMQGLEFKFPVGKGFFIGGQYMGYAKNTKKPSVANPNYHIWMNYNVGMGGVTVDKRIPLAKNFIATMGLMLGAASHDLEFLNSDSNYDWNTMGDIITQSNNTHIHLNKAYLAVQPRAELQYNFLSWMGIKAQAGYVYGHGFNQDWKVSGLDLEEFEVKNAPKTKLQGLSLSVGPWFGF